MHVVPTIVVPHGFYLVSFHLLSFLGVSIGQFGLQIGAMFLHGLRVGYSTTGLSSNECPDVHCKPDHSQPQSHQKNAGRMVVVGKHFTFFLWWLSVKSPLNC